MSQTPNLRSRTSTSSAPQAADDERAAKNSEPPRRLEVVPESLPPPSLPQRALESTANLANLLPTGTLLAFQLLTPIFTHNGSCDAATRPLTLALLSALALSCFLASFTDSVRAPAGGRVYYGIATPRGMRMFDAPAAAAAGITAKDLERYRVGLVDYVHAVLSVLVFRLPP
ncbi:unnamed protein product [Cuscuta campestris]|uniref:Uncharacterized protein n=1 Tax=Cuscuta campestris TaxID=132261 RepID=A0A484K3G1_9ASTE|nr:unnamed protein product [Cuscuta campestris]